MIFEFQTCGHLNAGTMGCVCGGRGRTGGKIGLCWKVMTIILDKNAFSYLQDVCGAAAWPWQPCRNPHRLSSWNRKGWGACKVLPQSYFPLAVLSVQGGCHGTASHCGSGSDEN